MLTRYFALLPLLALQASAWTTTCPAGQYVDANGICHTCADGFFKQNPQTTTNQATTCSPCSAGKTNNAGHTFCDSCPPGQFSTGGTTCSPCGPGTQPNGGQTGCNPCVNGQFSTGGTTCQNCPPGQTSNGAHNGCVPCQPGTYNNAPGGTCTSCPGGQFNSVQGAKSCCNCCAGWYSTTNGAATSCTQCPVTSPYSAVGSNTSGDCKVTRIVPGGGTDNDLPNYTTSCSMSGNVCPNTTGPGTVGTNITRRKRQVYCTRGFTACPRLSGRAGTDCVDTQNDPESCGGCVYLDGTGKGDDCTAMEGVNASRCVKGGCVIDSCLRGYIKSIDGASCVAAPRAGFGVQNPVARRNVAAKRSIRDNIY